MFVVRHSGSSGPPVELVSGDGAAVASVRDFLAHMAARGCSPHTVKAYAYDLRHLFAFLDVEALDWTALTPARAVAFLVHLGGRCKKVCSVYARRERTGNSPFRLRR